ncbi:MAG: GlsB/YeaQ/YmgE family stress response membrane protein [Anaerolineae bacterium]|nr:GlsB/YeaQ/YmgE family stress response membrane protein [Anaerolineae bacterium]
MDVIGNILAFPFVCLGWLIVGAIAGALAHSIMGGRDEPLINDIILGLIGSVVGGFVIGLFVDVSNRAGLGGVLLSIVVATIGAIILIAIGRMLRGRSPA